MAYRNYSVANGFTVATDGSGDFTTIAAALTAATSGMDIFIRPGTYTENLTLKAGVNLVAYQADAYTPNVIINGKCTATFSGTCSLSGICLQTNSDYCLVVSGANPTFVNLKGCYIYALNNTAINMTGGSKIQIYDSKADTGTSGVTYFQKSGNGAIKIFGGVFENNAASSTVSTCSAGSINFYSVTYFALGITTSGSGILLISNSIILGSIIIGGNSGADAITRSSINSATATALTINSGCTLGLYECTISSSNTNAIAGSGNLGYSGISFASTSSTIQNTLTLSLQGTSPANAASGRVLTSTGPNTSPTWQNPLFVFVQSQTASNSASLTFTNLNVYSVYYVAIRGMGPAVVNTQLQMQVSIDNGATFVSVGYANGINYSSYNSATVNNINSTTYIPLSSNMYNSNTFVCNFFLYNTSIGNPVSLLGQGSWRDNALGTSTGTYIGQGPTGVNAIRFIYSSGNIVTGTISLYGVTS